MNGNIPKDWFIEITDENRIILNLYCNHYSSKKVYDLSLNILMLKNEFKYLTSNFTLYHFKDNVIKNFTEITTEEFKKNVLKADE